MNETANQTTFDLIDRLLNASATFNNRSSRQQSPPSPLDPFRGIDLFDEASQELLNNIETLSGYTKLQRAMLTSISRNLMTSRSRGWRILFDDFKAFDYVAKATVSMLQSLFNDAVDKVRDTPFLLVYQRNLKPFQQKASSPFSSAVYQSSREQRQVLAH